jgi:ribA/ribD-fused uncharacterized protein
MKIIIENGKSKRISTVTEDSILGFFPPYRFLSNYHIIPIKMSDGLIYPSTENAYQAHKLLSIKDREPFVTYTCGEAKSAGGKVNLRTDWEKVKVDIMRSCLEVKFQNDELKAMLKATAPKYLEETNDWRDTYWGKVCGVGQNMLGRLLMEIRDRES